jgi:hypothetical protein
MSKEPSFDVAAAHRYFAAHCFNAAWDLIDKPARTADEDRLMESLSQASLYHWRQRPDCTAQQLSVGYWQASRIQALLGRAAEAARHGQACLEHSAGLPPFYLGYAYEALARAARLAGDATQAAAHLAQARAQAALVPDADDRTVLLKDLDGLAP